MDRFEQLKQKYAGVLDLIKRSNVSLSHLHVQDDKLFMQGNAPNQEIKNRVWDAIKAIDPSYSDLSADIGVDSSIPAPAEAHGAQGSHSRTYTVQPGDSLSKIAKQVYGDAGQYMKIFNANQDQLDDPDKIRAGQTLNIPE